MAVRKLGRGEVDPLVAKVMDKIEEAIKGMEVEDEQGNKMKVRNYVRRGQDILPLLEREDGSMDQVRITTSHY